MLQGFLRREAPIARLGAERCLETHWRGRVVFDDADRAHMPDNAADRSEQIGEVAGCGEKCDSSDMRGNFRGMGRVRDQDQRWRIGDGFDPPRELDDPDPRVVSVDDHDVDSAVLDHGQCVATDGHCKHRVTYRAQRRRPRVADLRICLDKKNTAHV